MRDTPTGIALLLVAGVMNASFTLPMKFTRKWRWENTWSVWSAWALLIMPSAVALSTVPRLATVYAQAGMGNVLLVGACGMGWGIAQVLFGLAVDVIGIALAFSIVLGLSAAMGSLLPLIRLHPDKVLTPSGFGVMAGVLLVLVGVAVCAVAGRKREKAMTAAATEGSYSTSAGLLIAIVSGIAAAAMNFGVAFGQPLINSAQAAGAGPAWSTSAVWVPLLAAGAVPNLVYCIFLMRKNRTFGKFGVRGTGSYWGLAALMAFLWFFGTLLYGVASGKLGELGPVLGWPFFMSLIVIAASLLSIMTGEWKNAGRGPLLIQMTGVGILVLAVIVLSQAGRYV
jgi:L-rhamnose-H+ transport protein